MMMMTVSEMSNFTTSSPINVSGDNAIYYCLYNVDNMKMKKVIAIIYIVTSTLSILGAGSVIIYAMVKRIVRSPEVHPLFHLALADFILASLWFTGPAVGFMTIMVNAFIWMYLERWRTLPHSF
ncbi:hypothetical protein OS493_004031 [Desmophyllum pertusum]|uniref:Uncharacterized protein n=1 Tax=Desmophyllum pertusum TaxID=174260 RepID=A0A9W9ZSH3_9CNID|nr:hypothetical protein OS493_004031 [Desmophyllum pertusum]